ncbi:MAG TPA: FAD-dependent oxidoreductase [Nakamurella sp.]
MHVVVIGGSDAGISAALRIRELDASVAVTVVVADAFPNFSICGIPYYISGEVRHWSQLAHRSLADLEATGLRLMLDTRAVAIDTASRQVRVQDDGGADSLLDYEALVVGTGAVPVLPPIDGLQHLGTADGVHVIHTMGDTLTLDRSLTDQPPRSALIVGAGYVGLEMAEALTGRGIAVTQVEMLAEVLPTVDPELGALVHAELTRCGVTVHTSTVVQRIEAGPGDGPRLRVEGVDPAGEQVAWQVDLVLVVVGVRPDTELLVAAGAGTGPRGAVLVDQTMATGLPQVWAAGDCVVTHHRQLGTTYVPLGTTAHKQGRVAGENAIGGRARFAGSLGTQVVKVFDLVAARTGIRDHEAVTLGRDPVTVSAVADDHKAYYPGAQPITIRVTGDRTTGQLLGTQLVGHRGTETAKRVDIYATALFHGMTVDSMADLDLSSTPPLGSPWDAVQVAAQTWVRATGPAPGDQPARVPTVLFVCEHNVGRSQLAAGLAASRAAGRMRVLSAGTNPDPVVDEVMLASLAEIGIDRSDQVPTQLTAELIEQADAVVAVKPGLGIVVADGAQLQTWTLPEPERWDVAGLRPLRDFLANKVQTLIEDLTRRR